MSENSFAICDTCFLQYLNNLVNIVHINRGLIKNLASWFAMAGILLLEIFHDKRFHH